MRFFVANVPEDYSTFSGKPPRILGYSSWSTRHQENIAALAERIKSLEPVPGRNAELVVTAIRDDASLAGLMVVSFRHGLNPHVVLEDIVVEKGHRSEGVGNALFKWVDEQARSLGLLSWYLETGNTNARAHKFFERLGFKPRAVIMELYRAI
ncbi:MAG: GNAT family N-acetyltransferase [bacterium]